MSETPYPSLFSDEDIQQIEYLIFSKANGIYPTLWNDPLTRRNIISAWIAFWLARGKANKNSLVHYLSRKDQEYLKQKIEEELKF